MVFLWESSFFVTLSCCFVSYDEYEGISAQARCLFVSFLLAREMLDPVGHDDSVRVFTKLAIIEFLAVNADGKTAVFAQFLVAFTC